MAIAATAPVLPNQKKIVLQNRPIHWHPVYEWITFIGNLRNSMYISKYYFSKAVRETAVSRVEIATRLYAFLQIPTVSVFHPDLGHEGSLSSPPIAEVKNGWSSTSSYVYMAWTGINSTLPFRVTRLNEVSSNSSLKMNGEILLAWEDCSDMFGQFRTVSYTLTITYKSENSRTQSDVCAVVPDTTIQRENSYLKDQLVHNYFKTSQTH